MPTRTCSPCFTAPSAHREETASSANGANQTHLLHLQQRLSVYPRSFALVRDCYVFTPECYPPEVRAASFAPSSFQNHCRISPTFERVYRGIQRPARRGQLARRCRCKLSRPVCTLETSSPTSHIPDSHLSQALSPAVSSSQELAPQITSSAQAKHTKAYGL